MLVSEACDLWLSHRTNIHPKTMKDYSYSAQAIKGILGERPVEALTPFDFNHLQRETAKKWGIWMQRRLVTRTRQVFSWVNAMGLASLPRYGPDFKKPRVIPGLREIYTSEDLSVLLNHAEIPMLGFILLGISGGFGPTDCLRLEWRHVGKDSIEFPRPKTGVPRVVPIWDELLAVLPKWQGRGRVWTDPLYDDLTLSKRFTKLCNRHYIPRLGFYTLRHTFRTIADQVGDQRAADRIMGHATPGMGSAYVHHVDPARLIRVSNHVHQWLFSTTAAATLGAGIPTTGEVAASGSYAPAN